MANHKINFNPSTCIGCKVCYKSCFVDVIRWDENKKLPVFKYVEDCVHCTYCEALCPKDCIEVVIDFEGERVYQNFDAYR